METCPDCIGSGKVPDHTKPLIKETSVRGYWQRTTCPRCGGTGKIESNKNNSGCVVLLPLIGTIGLLTASALLHPATAFAQQMPPGDFVEYVESRYWNFTQKKNDLPEGSVYLGARIKKCKSVVGHASSYRELLECSVKISYRRPDGSRRTVSRNAKYGLHSDGKWWPVITVSPKDMPRIKVAPPSQGH